MANQDLAEMIWNQLQSDIAAINRRVDDLTLRSERSEIADNIPAYTLATAPLAAQGGLGDGMSYITLAWISDGRKAAEGAGAGTGVLAVYQASTDQWLRLTDYTAVVI